MTTCQDFATDLELHHDGELDPPGVQRLERHLGACEACRARSGALSWLGAELRARDSVAPGPDLWASIDAIATPVPFVIASFSGSTVSMRPPTRVTIGSAP